MSAINMMDVVVTDVVEVNSLIKRFHFARAGGAPLPAFSAGSHIIVEMHEGEKIHRSPYTLMGSPIDPSDYQISIRRDDEGRGGSLYMHRNVTKGMAMRISMPVNFFPLDSRADKHLMIAGGIGITPFMAHAAQLMSTGNQFELHYGVRSRELATYVNELSTSIGPRLHAYIQNQGQEIDFDDLLSRQPHGTHLYICGPEAMINLVIEKAKAHSWPDNHVHYELFAKAPAGEPFSVDLKATGKTIRVGKNQSLLEAMESAGVDAPYLCRGGACGQCETDVVELDGKIKHQDYWLDEDEKFSSTKIMPCVSRFSGNKLVIDR